MPTTATKATIIVTREELSELAEWERKHAEAKKKVSIAEKELAFRRQALAEKVLGISTTEELKQLSPEKLLKICSKRLEAGDWKPERGAPSFAFVQTSAGCYPAWAKLYAQELGETAANRVKAETPKTYSYSVEVAQSA